VTLTLHLRSGEKIRRHLDEVKWSPERLPTWQELVEKFRMLADPLIGARKATRAVDMIAGFRPSDTLSALMPLLVAEAPSKRMAEKSSRASKSVKTRK
jgi:hypothetical protein